LELSLGIVSSGIVSSGIVSVSGGTIAANPGDANADGVVNAADFFIWQDNRFSSEKTWFEGDFSGDYLVDVVDFNIWNSNRVDELPGDANVDGMVDGLDLAIWSANKFTSNKTWFEGDFSGDGNVDGVDFNIWSENRTDLFNIEVIVALAAATQAPLTAEEDDFDFFNDGEIKLGGTYGLDTDSDLTAYLTSMGKALGDADLDGNVDAVDYGVVMANFNQTGTTWKQGDFNGDGATNFFDLVVWTINMTDDTGVDGDLTNDAAVTATDIDAMFEGLSVLANTSNSTYVSWLNSMYDLNDDGTIDQLDADFLVENIIGTAYGDANLDGFVDAIDLNTAVLNLNTSVDSWTDGDFNGDGVVDEDDLDLIYANWGFGT